MVENNAKEIIDVRPNTAETVEETAVKEDNTIPSMFFTVTAVSSKGPVHILVKAATAIEALQHVQEVEKAPVVGVHVTEYTGYLNAQEELEAGIEESRIVSV